MIRELWEQSPFRPVAQDLKELDFLVYRDTLSCTYDLYMIKEIWTEYNGSRYIELSLVERCHGGRVGFEPGTPISRLGIRYMHDGIAHYKEFGYGWRIVGNV